MGLVYVADVNSSLFPISEIVFVSILRLRAVSYNCSLYAPGNLSEKTANGWYWIFYILRRKNVRKNTGVCLSNSPDKLFLHVCQFCSFYFLSICSFSLTFP